MVTMHIHNSVSQSGPTHGLAEHHLFRYNCGLTVVHEAVLLHVSGNHYLRTLGPDTSVLRTDPAPRAAAGHP